MKRWLILVSLIALFILIATVSPAGPFTCGGDVVCNCGNTLISSRILNATDNLTNCTGNGLLVTNSSITLDCNGRSITGNNTGVGINLSTVTGDIIKNCEISGFSQGILSVDSSGNLLDNNTIINPLERGIHLYNTSNSNVTNNNISNASIIGIFVEAGGISSYNLVQGNNITISKTPTPDYSLYGIKIEDDNNIISDNKINCQGKDTDQSGIGVFGVTYNANDNSLSGNEVHNCSYGLYTHLIDSFEADDEEYHDNTYGAYFDDMGSTEPYPLIENSLIYNNSYGVYVLSNYVRISNTNFTNNTGSEGGPKSGIHVEGTGTAYVDNGNFDSNGQYGIYDEGPDSVYWILSEDVYCTDNDISIDSGGVIPSGGEIIADNCTITVNGEELNLSGGETGSYSVPFNEASNNVFGNSSYGVEGEIHTAAGTYTGDLIVDFYEENPGGSGFLLADFGLWVNASLSPAPADLSWWILKIYYSEEDLAASGLNEADLVIQFYNASDDTWTTELDQGVNESENYVWANLTHFSVFGIFEDEEETVSGGHRRTVENETNITNVSVELPEEIPEVPEQAPGEPEAEPEPDNTLLITFIVLALIVIAAVIGFRFWKK